MLATSENGGLEKLIAAAFDAASDAIAINTRDGRVAYINQTFTAVYGYSLADMQRKRMGDIRSPACRDGLAADLERAAESDGLVYETEHMRADGTVFPVEVRISHIVLGEEHYWISVLRDITPLRAAEERAETLRRLYDALLAANAAMVSSPDRETLFARVCEACVAYGFRLAWIGLIRGDRVEPVSVAGLGAGYVEGIHVSTREDDPSGRGPTGTTARTGKPLICNDFFADDNTAPWRERAVRYGVASSATIPLREGGEIIGVLTLYAGQPGFFGPDEAALLEQFATTASLALDRLAAEQASWRLTGHPLVRAILDAVPITVFIAHDPECRVITGNLASERVCRRRAGSNLSKGSPDSESSHFQLLVDGTEVPPHKLPVERAARGEVVEDEILEVRHDDGTSIHIQGGAVPLRDASGALSGAVGVFMDITQRRKEQEALIAARDTAERAVAAKSRFLAAASHDLRQPIQGLVLMLEILSQRLSGTDGMILEKAQSCAITLSEMVADLLDVAKLDAGVIAVEKAAHAVSDLLRDLMPPHEAAAAAKGLAFAYVPSDVKVRTDAALLRRIVGNLLSNAVKYTATGKVLLGCRRRGGFAWIEVWDTGIGIPPERQEEIFEEFLQLDNPERSREKGSGLGLAIVDRSARLLGAKVTVCSVPGQGSRFAVKLPLAV